MADGSVTIPGYGSDPSHFIEVRFSRDGRLLDAWDTGLSRAWIIDSAHLPHPSILSALTSVPNGIGKISADDALLGIRDSPTDSTGPGQSAPCSTSTTRHTPYG